MEIETDTIKILNDLNTKYDTSKKIRFFDMNLQDIFHKSRPNIEISFNKILEESFTTKIDKLDKENLHNFENEFNILIYVFNFNIDINSISLKFDNSEQKKKFYNKYNITTTKLYKAIEFINSLIEKSINDKIINENYLKLFEKYYKIVSKLYNNKYVIKTNFMEFFTSNKSNTKYYMLDFYTIEYLILKYFLNKYDYLKQFLINSEDYNNIVEFFNNKFKTKNRDGYIANTKEILEYIKKLKIIFYNTLTDNSTIDEDIKIEFMNDFLKNDETYREDIINHYNNILFLKKIKELCLKVNTLNKFNLDEHDCENIDPYKFLESFKQLCILLNNNNKYYNILNDIIKFIKENIDKYADILNNLSTTRQKKIIEWTDILESLYLKFKK